MLARRTEVRVDERGRAVQWAVQSRAPCNIFRGLSRGSRSPGVHGEVAVHGVIHYDPAELERKVGCLRREQRAYREQDPTSRGAAAPIATRSSTTLLRHCDIHVELASGHHRASQSRANRFRYRDASRLAARLRAWVSEQDSQSEYVLEYGAVSLWMWSHDAKVLDPERASNVEHLGSAWLGTNFGYRSGLRLWRRPA